MTEIRNAFKKALEDTTNELKLELKSHIQDVWIRGVKSPKNETIRDWNKAGKPNKKKTKLKND